MTDDTIRWLKAEFVSLHGQIDKIETKVDEIGKMTMNHQFYVDHSKAFFTYGTVLALSTVLGVLVIMCGSFASSKEIKMNTKGREINTQDIQDIKGEKILGYEWKKSIK